MAANINPIFALVPQVPSQTITATTTDKSGATTTNIKTLYTAASNGTKVTQIGFKCVGNSSAGTFLIWLTDTSGANTFLFDEILIAAVTSSTTVATYRAVNIYSDLELKAGQQILIGATVVTTSIFGFAQIGDY